MNSPIVLTISRVHSLHSLHVPVNCRLFRKTTNNTHFNKTDLPYDYLCQA